MPEPQLDPKVAAKLKQLSIQHKVLPCEPELADTAAFCEHYGYGLDTAANTILVASRKVEPVRYAACVVLATTRLDVNKKVCQLLEVKRASFASSEQTQELSGMMIGGVTIFGLPPEIPIFVDSAVMAQSEVIMGGGNRSSKLLLYPKELQKLPGLQVIEGLANPPPSS